MFGPNGRSFISVLIAMANGDKQANHHHSRLNTFRKRDPDGIMETVKGGSMMIFTFYPWKLDIDPEAAKELYLAEDDTVDKKVNERFIQSLNEEQRTFFDALGVDLTKVRAEEKRHDISDERADADTLIMTSVDFLMKGKLLAIPDYQHSLYADEEVFGESFPGSVEVIKMPADQQLPFYDVDGMKIIFKHPYFHFDEEQYKSWDCGAVMGSVLLSKEEK